MGGKKRVDGLTAEGVTWVSLYQHGPADINELARRFPDASKRTICSRVIGLRAKGLAGYTGGRMARVYFAIGDSAPDDGRMDRHPDLLGCSVNRHVVQRGREGTPGEVPQVPSLATLLLG